MLLSTPSPSPFCPAIASLKHTDTLVMLGAHLNTTTLCFSIEEKKHSLHSPKKYIMVFSNRYSLKLPAATFASYFAVRTLPLHTSVLTFRHKIKMFYH